MKFQKGDKVYYKKEDKHGEVTGDYSILSEDIVMVAVNFNGNIRKVSEKQLTLEMETGDMFSKFKNGNFDNFNRFRQLLTHIRINGELTNIIYSMKYGSVDFLPHQFKPVIKFITSNTGRLLIADEVGLGKTIEALYIWRELQARDDAKRLLVVAPSALVEKWCDDMINRFGIDVQSVKAEELNAKCIRTLNDDNTEFELVTSIQSIRNRAGLKDDSPLKMLHETLNKAKGNERKLFDLVIIDEAHSLINKASSNHRLAEKLRDLSENMLLLSATPVNNSSKDLFNLLSLMEPKEFRNENQFNNLFEDNKYVVRLFNLFQSPPNNKKIAIKEAKKLLSNIISTHTYENDKYFSFLDRNLESFISSDEERTEAIDRITNRFFYDSYITRSRKKDVMKTSLRSSQTAAFNLSDTELDIYDKCTFWIERRMISNPFSDSEKTLFPFVLMSRQREMDSSLPAAVARWKKILSAYGSNDEDNEALEEYLQDSSYSSESIEEANLESIPSICKELTQTELEKLEKNDTKYKEFLETIIFKQNQCRNENKTMKVIVFSFFRATLDYLYRRLTSDGFKTIMINGALSRRDKTASIEKFKNDETIQILLSSEVGAEGLDMQFADTEINYDLPWNPMRLEQRIGRIDRIGQKSDKIYIINLFSRNTISDRIRQALYDKIQIFTDSIGELDDIMGQTVKNIEMNLLSSTLSDSDKEKEAKAEINRLYNNILQVRKLEEDAGITRAYSDRILEYVGNTEKNNRYIRREDLINFIDDFCKNDGHGTRFERDKNNKEIWHLMLSKEDRFNFHNYARRNNLRQDFSNANDIICTFPQGKRMSRNCNIDVNHPFIKWILDITNKVFEKNSDRCYCMSIPRSCIEAGRYASKAYVFYMTKFKLEGLRTKNELLSIAYSLDTHCVLDANDSEYLISQTLFNGSNISSLHALISNYSKDDMSNALESCKEEIENRRRNITAEFFNDDNDLLQRMLAKTSDYYENAIKTAEENIKKQEEANAKESVIKGLRTRKERLKERREEEIENLKTKAIIDPVQDDIAVGMIFIN